MQICLQERHDIIGMKTTQCRIVSYVVEQDRGDGVGAMSKRSILGLQRAVCANFFGCDEDMLDAGQGWLRGIVFGLVDEVADEEVDGE